MKIKPCGKRFIVANKRCGAVHYGKIWLCGDCKIYEAAAQEQEPELYESKQTSVDVMVLLIFVLIATFSMILVSKG